MKLLETSYMYSHSWRTFRTHLTSSKLKGASFYGVNKATCLSPAKHEPWELTLMDDPGLKWHYHPGVTILFRMRSYIRAKQHSSLFPPQEIQQWLTLFSTEIIPSFSKLYEKYKLSWTVHRSYSESTGCWNVLQRAVIELTNMYVYEKKKTQFQKTMIVF